MKYLDSTRQLLIQLMFIKELKLDNGLEYLNE